MYKNKDSTSIRPIMSSGTGCCIVWVPWGQLSVLQMEQCSVSDTDSNAIVGSVYRTDLDVEEGDHPLHTAPSRRSHSIQTNAIWGSHSSNRCIKDGITSTTLKFRWILALFAAMRGPAVTAFRVLHVRLSPEQGQSSVKSLDDSLTKCYPST